MSLWNIYLIHIPNHLYLIIYFIRTVVDNYDFWKIISPVVLPWNGLSFVNVCFVKYNLFNYFQFYFRNLPFRYSNWVIHLWDSLCVHFVRHSVDVNNSRIYVFTSITRIKTYISLRGKKFSFLWENTYLG